jgi:hypothetical protein
MRARLGITAGVVACLFATVAPALAADGVTVPAGGQIGGYGYGQWLRISWQKVLATPPGASVCQSVPTPAGRVGILMGGFSGKKEQYACNEPAGRPIYVFGLSAECSTIEKPPFHGDTPRELKRCARREMKGARNLLTSIDGQPVADYTSLIAASPVFSFRMPRHNVLHISKRSGRSAAYGVGLLIRGLTAGAHTVHVTGQVGDFLVDVTYTLQVA